MAGVVCDDWTDTHKGEVRDDCGDEKQNQATTVPPSAIVDDDCANKRINGAN